MKCIYLLSLLLICATYSDGYMIRGRCSHITFFYRPRFYIYDSVGESLPVYACSDDCPDDPHEGIAKSLKRSQRLKDKLVQQMPDADDVILVDANGIHCDVQYCEKAGANGMGTLGFCNRQYCACVEGVAEERTCEESLVFDPQKGICATKDKAVLCH